MEKERYQILYRVVVCGEESECLCGVKTDSGDFCFVWGKEKAERRVNELVAMGYNARYVLCPYGSALCDDDNWIG